jgi:hypothetical protein
MPKQIIIGAVGLGTELNPPLFRVIPPKKAPAPYPFTPPACPSDGTVTCVLSGIVSCGCVETVGSPPSIMTISLDGTYTLAWNSTNGDFEDNGVGSYSLQAYDFSDSTCTGAPVGAPVTGTWSISANCAAGVWAVSIVDSMGAGFTAFTDASGPLGAPINNGITCGGLALVGGGTATLTR